MERRFFLKFVDSHLREECTIQEKGGEAYENKRSINKNRSD